MDTVGICNALYSATEQFLTDINFEPKYGFKILNGPPIPNANILFVGYQPGGKTRDWENEKEILVHNSTGTHKGWPPVCEYATAPWPLAPKMQRVFGKQRLTRCVGTNAIFLRYPDTDCYRREVGAKRGPIEEFCKERVKSIVTAVNPKRIVTIGFKALEMFGSTEPGLRRLKNKNHALTKTGHVAGRPAVGMIHLTGAHLSNAELDLLSNYFRSS